VQQRISVLKKKAESEEEAAARQRGLVIDERVERMVAGGALDEVERVLAEGETKASVVLKSGMQVDLRCVKKQEFPFALHYFTGSKEHNTHMRMLAKDRGWKLNEYGLFDGEKLLACKDESALFSRLGMQYIPPELREERGEIEAAHVLVPLSPEATERFHSLSGYDQRRLKGYYRPPHGKRRMYRAA